MPSEKSPAYQRYPKDYLGDENVMVMTLEQEGAYNRLMDVCWLEGSIPADVRKLAALCKNVPAKKMQVIWAGISMCFIPHATLPDRLDHPRLQKERDKQERWRTKSSNGGKKAMSKRWAKDNHPNNDPNKGGYEMVTNESLPNDNIAVCSLQSALKTSVSNETGGEPPKEKTDKQWKAAFAIGVREHLWLGNHPPARVLEREPEWDLGREVTIGEQWAKEHGGWDVACGVLELLRSLCGLDADVPMSCYHFHSKTNRARLKEAVGMYQKRAEHEAAKKGSFAGLKVVNL